MKRIIFILSLLFINNLILGQITVFSLDDLCNNSKEIVIAKQVSKEYSFNEKTKRVYTEYTFIVLESLKGELFTNDKFEIKLYGGTHNGLTTFSPDYPSFINNEESLLFMNPNKKNNLKNNKFSLTALSQGKFKIKYENDGEKIIYRDNFYSPLVVDDNNSKSKITKDIGIELGILKNRINDKAKNKG